MIKFIHCADLHLGIKKYGIINPKTGVCTRIEEDLKQFDRVVNYAIKKKVNYFIIAGDVFDKRKPDEYVRKEFVKRIRRLISKKIVTVILIGNHEGVTAKDTAHCLSGEQIISKNKYLYIVDEVKTLEFKDLSIICLPYYSKMNNAFFSKKVPAILIGHMEIKGSKQNGHVFNGGISPLIFDRDLVYVGMGHIHEYQQVGRVVYAGGINRINFGDEGIKKGFIKGTILSNKCDWKFVKMDSRVFKTIEGKWSDDLLNEIKRIKVDGEVVRIIISSTKKYVPITEIKRILHEHGATVDSVIVKRKVAVKIRDKHYRSSIKPEKLLKRYLSGKKERTIKKGLKILKKVRECC